MLTPRQPEGCVPVVVSQDAPEEGEDPKKRSTVARFHLL
jgi:hypothetical protein